MVLNAVNSATSDLEIEQSERMEFTKVDSFESTIEEPQEVAPKKRKYGRLTGKLIKQMEEENVRELRSVT